MEKEATEPKEKKTFWQIIEDQKAIDAALEALAESPDSEEAKKILQDALNNAAESEKDKVDAYAGLMTAYDARAKIAKAEADTYSDEVKRLKGIQASFEGKVESLKAMLKEIMKLKGVDVLESDTNRFRLMNSPSAKLVFAEGEYQIPEEFTRVSVVPDTEKIKSHLTLGGKLDFAHLEVGQYVRKF